MPTAGMSRRVVSLAPSATSIIRTLGETDRLVGMTDHDGRDTIGGWLTPDLDRVEELDPELVITTDALQAEIVGRLDERGIETVHFEPRTLDEAIEYIAGIGAAIGCPERGDELATATAKRIEGTREIYAGSERPIVYCEEWGEPPMVAGNWVPEVVRAAGGRYPFLEPGERSKGIAYDVIRDASPDLGILHHCGRGDDIDPDLFDRRGWDIPQVHVIDDDLLNQPGPQLATAVETLGAYMHDR